jgi:hypothetical protein
MENNKMNSFYFCDAEVACYANDNDAFVPEMWANEGLMILEENMVMAHLVHRDFENEVQRYGDVVNTRRPNKFNVARKVDGGTLSYQDATATNVPVTLDQWFVSPFTIYDGEDSLSFKDLVAIYLKPAMLNIANGVDRAVTGQMHKFFGGVAARVGRLENLPAATSNDTVLEARQVLNDNLAPMDAQRHLLLSSASETALLKNDIFVKANERGDEGTALENARLGRIYGFQTWMGQNVPGLVSGTTIAGTVTGAEVAGETGALSCTLGATVVGEFINVAGNDQPTYCTAITAATTDFTLNEALKYATGAGAVCTAYTSDTVNHPSAGTYAIGWTQAIGMDNIAYFTVGQLCAFGTGANRRTYTVIEVVGNDLWLDRPLEVAVADGAAAFPGPQGNYNLAFHREALALITRPLALPRAGTGVVAGVASYNGISMRITMQYNQSAGGTQVNCDMLAGVAVLDTNLACVMLG